MKPKETFVSRTMSKDLAMSSELSAKLKVRMESFVCVPVRVNASENRLIPLCDLQQIKCRRIVRTHPDLFACPDPSFLDEIVIFAPQELAEKGSLRDYLDELNLTEKKQKLSLCEEMLKSAILFSIVARIWPEWSALVQNCNDNGETLIIRGSNFLIDSSKSPADAMTVRIFNKGPELWIGARICQIRLPILKLEYLNISSYYMNKLSETHGRHVDGSKIGKPLVYVIPSLKRARMEFLSNGLPLDSDFQNFRQIGHHWNEAYGIVLTREEPFEPAFLASVKFEDDGYASTCPLQCLLSSPPVYYKHEHPNKPAEIFLLAIKPIVEGGVIFVNGREFAVQQREKDTSEEELPIQETEIRETSRNGFPEAPISVEGLSIAAPRRKVMGLRAGLCFPRPPRSNSTKSARKTDENVRPTTVSSTSKKSRRSTTLSESPLKRSSLRLSTMPPRDYVSMCDWSIPSKKPKVGSGSSNIAVPLERSLKNGLIESATVVELRNWLRARNVTMSLPKKLRKHELVDLVRRELSKGAKNQFL